MRTKVEIERSLAEMKRMADDARRGLAKAKEMNATVLVKHFEQWKTKCEARAQILSWVLGQELNEDVPPQLPQAPVSHSPVFGIFRYDDKGYVGYWLNREEAERVFSKEYDNGEWYVDEMCCQDCG